MLRGFFSLFNSPKARRAFQVVTRFSFFFLALTAISYLLSLFSFPSGIEQKALNQISLWLILLTLIVNFKSILKIKSHLFPSRKKWRQFLLLSGANIFVTFFLVVIYAIFQYGSPLIYESHPKNFKVKKTIPLVNGTVVRQEFKAESNNLGTIGIRLSVKKLEAKEDKATEDEEFKSQTKEEQENISPKPAEIIFRIKEKGSPDWFYENIYYFDKPFSDQFYLFGFPIQSDSKDKNYIFELLASGEKENEENTNDSFLITVPLGRNNQPYFYSRYVYSKGKIKKNITAISVNATRKLIAVLENQELALTVIVHLIIFSILIFAFLNINNGGYFSSVIKYNFLIFLSLVFILSIFQKFLFKNFPKSIFYNYLSILTVILGSLFFYQEKTTRAKAESLDTKKKIKVLNNLVIIIFIIVLGSFLRIWKLGYLYPAGDEYRHLNAAKHFLAEGYFEYPRSPLVTYIVIGIRKVFNTNSLFLQRLPFAIIGSFSIFLFYLIGKKQNFWIGIISAYLFAICPLAIGLSRYIREYEIILFISLFFIYLSGLELIKNKPVLLLFLVPLFAVAGKLGLSQGYQAAFFLFFIFTIVRFLFIIANKSLKNIPSNLSRFIKISMFLSLFLIGLRMIPVFTDYHILSSPEWRYLFLLNYLNSDSTVWYLSFAPYSFVFLLTIVSLIKRPKDPWIIALYFTVFFTFFFYLWYLDAPRRFQDRYIYYLLPYFIMLISSGIYYSLEFFKKTKQKTALILFVIILVFSFSSYKAINFAFNDENGKPDPRTGLAHFDAGKLKQFLDREKISPGEVLTSYPYFFDYYYNNPYLKTDWEKKKFVHFPWSYEYFDRTQIFSINGYWNQENITQIKDLIRNNNIKFLVFHASCKDKRADRQYGSLLNKINNISSYAIIDSDKTFCFYIYKVINNNEKE